MNGSPDREREAATMTRRAFSLLPAALFLAVLVFAGCSREEEGMTSGHTPDYRQAAIEFTRALVGRDYPSAYAMTSQGYRLKRSVDQLRSGFEAMIPTDWGAIGPIEVGQTMTSWPGRQPSDLGWVYVSVGGDVYSEAVTVVVTLENGEAKIREVEFGRP
jgi:hypothetical protein